MIAYRAPAKMILSGEHSVVYGKPAFVSSINRYLTATATRADTDSPEHTLIISTVRKYLQKKSFSFSNSPISLSVSSDIPIGRGLGSSAAYAVAGVAAVLHELMQQPPDKQVVNSLSYVVEKHFHKNPSGVDVSASCFGGLIYFRKEFEFLKTISALPYKIPSLFAEHMYLIDSGKPQESTAAMVEMVGKQYNRDSQAVSEHLNKLEKITKRMVVSVVQENISLFENCIRENQEALVKLGVVSSHTQDMLKALSPYGVGKITGAGGLKAGSGYMIFLTRDREDAEQFLRSQKFECMKVITDSHGLTPVDSVTAH